MIKAYLLSCVLLCLIIFFITMKMLTEPRELPINCADFAWNPIDPRLVSSTPAILLSPEQARTKAYFHEQQMKRQIVSFDTNAKHFFQRNWEPSYSCTITGRMGCPGDGGKWVCDPHHFLMQDRCVVYSVGSNNEFSFEEAIHRFNPQCEIHTFDPSPPSKKPTFVHFHPWTLGSTDSFADSTFTVQTMMHHLGHNNITILKADCEGCELNSFNIATFPAADGAIQQILIEVHFDGQPGRVHSLFNFLSSKEYAIFSKEPNTQYSNGKAVEFSLVHLFGV